MMAPAEHLIRTLWHHCLCQGQHHGPWCTPSRTSTPNPTQANLHPTMSCPAIATHQEVLAVNTAKVSLLLKMHYINLTPILKGKCACTHQFSSLCFSISLTGSRSSGSTRSEGERRRGSKGGGSTSGRDEKSPVGGGADSRSGSGSESEYSVRSSRRRDHGSATPSEHSLSLSQRSHHRVPPTHLAPYPPGIPIPYNPMMVMMVPQHPHPHPAMGAPIPTLPTLQALPPSSTPGGPPGAPPTRDLGSVPPELTASRQSFHLAMGNPSEFFVDVM